MIAPHAPAQSRSFGFNCSLRGSTVGR